MGGIVAGGLCESCAFMALSRNQFRRRARDGFVLLSFRFGENSQTLPTALGLTLSKIFLHTLVVGKTHAPKDFFNVKPVDCESDGFFTSLSQKDHRGSG